MSFTLYVALGDSMSSDHYPTCDVRGLDAPPGRLDPLGAAALLHRNDDGRWPEFRGLDLETISPDVEFLGLAEDGAMIDDVATEELARIGRDSSDPDILLTLSAGGNDLLDALAAGRKLESAVSLASRRYMRPGRDRAGGAAPRHADPHHGVRSDRRHRAAAGTREPWPVAAGVPRAIQRRRCGRPPTRCPGHSSPTSTGIFWGMACRRPRRALVLEQEPDRAQRQGRERDPAGLVGAAG